jgi:hypothetical protein
MKPLAQIEYTNTNKEESFLKPLKPDMGYVPSSSEKETITNVLKRFMDMKSARTRIDTDWQLWKKISESKYYPYADGRTRVNVPVLRALQELFVAEATSRKIDKDIQPV